MKAPTVEEIRGRRYGHFKDVAYNQLSCASTGYMSWWMQCYRKPGHGPHGAFCKQHANQYEVSDDE